MDVPTITISAVIAVLVQVIGIFWLKERLKQSIRHEYDKDLESVKKDLEFELDKKKKLYEGKLTQYKKYYALLDQYQTQSRTELFSKYVTGILGMLENPSDENTLNWIKDIIPLQADVYDKFMTFKHEINGLRLESGEKLLKILDEYVKELEIAGDKTTSFLTEMNVFAVQNINNPEFVQQRINDFQNHEFSTTGKNLLKMQENIFIEMRRELGIF